MRTRTTTRRGLTAVAALSLAAVALVACSPEEEGTDGDGAGDESSAYQDLLDNGIVADDATVEANEWANGVREAGVLTVGGTETSELFSLLDPTTGVARGFDAALSQLLSRYILGEVNTDLQQVTVDTREDLLETGAVDTIFATYSITPERAARVAFAGPYYSSQSGILVPVDSDITGLDDLDGATVATQAASTGVTVLEEFAPGATILELPDHAQALAAVQQGNADAYVIDQSLLLNAVVTNDDVQIVGEPFGPGDNYGIGLPKDSDAQEFVNEWLQQIIDDGTWAELWQITIGDRADIDTAPEPPVIGSVEGS
ncbi:transporter substrate-binding domain-containing protein [Occultella gossypii]|uniref:Transporter substrate-binding domain-containing protein n=1 Tax=Occultella gossypii TaxID=2800820 RepID=A0ABS7S6D8_9MICO|nr:transporter substrate-binding domain-containing protein [Occultella gossypii]MBZ2195325.1 transporter substrate-binding domain-containing protein [Occultella gossypii]